jgi:hypothetical protein
MSMPKFLTIGYGEREGYDQTPEAMREAAHRNDAELVAGGAEMGMLGEPVRVTNTHQSGVVTERGPFMQVAMPVAGFALIEADSIEEAAAMVAGSPCAVASGVIEVWPVETTG